MSSGKPRVTSYEHDFSLATISSNKADMSSIGAYSWGAVNVAQKLNFGLDEFSYRYGKPNDVNYIQHGIVSDHLQYNTSVWLVRVAGNNASNANSSGSFIRVDNANDYHAKYEQGLFNGTPFIGRYPGSLVNNMRVDIITKDTYNDYPYKDSFKEEPLNDGEFHIAVIDASGAITSNGATKQKEKISVTTNNVFSFESTIQEEELIVTCNQTPAWTNGKKQTSQIKVSGVCTLSEKTISVFGVSVDITDAMSTAQITNAIKIALVNSKQFIEVLNVTDGLKVTYLNAAPQPIYSNIGEDGIEIRYSVIESGWLELKFSYLKTDITYRYAMYSPIVNHANGIANAIASSLINNLTNKITVADVYGNVITVRRAVSGVVKMLDSYNENGIIVSASIKTKGTISTILTFNGLRIEMTIDSDNITKQVVEQLKQSLIATNQYESISVENNSLIVVHKTSGYKQPFKSTAESGIVLSCSILTNGFDGSIVEKYQNMQSNPNAKKGNGADAYYFDVVNKNSNYIWCGEDLDTTCSNSFVLLGGVDDFNVPLADGLNAFKSKNTVPMRGMFLYSTDVFDYKTAIDICAKRMDAVCYISLPKDVVFRNAYERAQAAVEWKTYTLAHSSSYVFIDAIWGEFYDASIGKYKWIPACGQVSAKAANSFATGEYHQPIAGVQRGGLNYRSFAWVADDDEQDLLYDNQINSASNELGSVVLFGQKTGTPVNSSFNRLNVRNTFIVLESDIGDFGKFYQFQLHDSSVYRMFELAVSSYLQQLKDEKKIEDFYVASLEALNTQQIKSENKLLSRIGVKPKDAIEYVELHFYNVSNVALFSEII
jgi:hypothetical protein